MALTDKLTAVADAIRSKTGTTDPMTLDAMAEAVAGLKVGSFPNGTEWTQSNLTYGMQHAIYLCEGGIWVLAAGMNSTLCGIYYSTDGKNWIQSNITNGRFSTLKYAKGVWLATGNGNSYIYRSTDGKTWTEVDLNLEIELGSIVYVNGIWSVYNLNYADCLYYSNDGVTWVKNDSLTCKIRNIISNDAISIASTSDLSGLYYSHDGISWVSSNITSGSFSYPIYANGIWLVSSSLDQGVYYSKDGMTWTQSSITTGSFNLFAGTNGTILAYTTPSYTSSVLGVYYSTDGITWNSSNIESNKYTTAHYANGMFVLGSSYASKAYYSEDGITWTQITGVFGFARIVYENGVWIATGIGGKYYYSTDGKTWTATNIASNNGGGTPVCANGIWVVNGNNYVYYSVAWEPTA